MDETANAALEFAVVFWILVLVFLGIVDYGRFLYYDTAIRSAAKVGLVTAMNPCSGQSDCLPGAQPLSDASVMWAAYCEGQPRVELSPRYTSCPAHGDVTPSCVNGCNACSRDVCVEHLAPDNGFPAVRVTVGYSFRPFTFLMNQFFVPRSCFPGDTVATNGHTLCVSYVGRVEGGL